MSTSNKLSALLLLTFLIPLAASADVLMLKNGQAITGKFQGADATTVNFLANGQTRSYSINDVNSITFTSSPTPITPPAAERNAPEGRPTLSRRSEPSAGSGAGTLTPSPSADYGTTAASRPPAAAPRRQNVSVHAGSIITVRMIDPVDSATDVAGQTFRANLDEPLMVDGETVIPRGADVTAKLVSKEEAGRIQGRSELTLVLMDITIQGRKQVISTSEVTQAGSSRGKQSAERVGAGAAIGAVIGAIAGGGKGAAIGAATGGAAGGAIQVMTHGEQVKIPAETRLEFTLAQPLNF